MSKWVRFTRAFNFVPKKKASITIQHAEGDVDDVTDEHAAKAIEKKAAVEIVAPANTDEAAKLRSGAVKPVDVVVAAPADKAEKPSAPK